MSGVCCSGNDIGSVAKKKTLEGHARYYLGKEVCVCVCARVCGNLLTISIRMVAVNSAAVITEC